VGGQDLHEPAGRRKVVRTAGRAEHGSGR
jgi:hypothetical protein